MELGVKTPTINIIILSWALELKYRRLYSVYLMCLFTRCAQTLF
ncbi:hypothetical protein HPAKL117_06385 [Helicobacter pylori Aklavik117]|nr:hypothetical protein HPAKL117_06385 [Helicobacter pylori Aklavik117]